MGKSDTNAFSPSATSMNGSNVEGKSAMTIHTCQEMSRALALVVDVDGSVRLSSLILLHFQSIACLCFEEVTKLIPHYSVQVAGDYNMKKTVAEERSVSARQMIPNLLETTRHIYTV